MSRQFEPASYSKINKMDYTWGISYHRCIVAYDRLPQLNFISCAQCNLSIAEVAPPSWLFLDLFKPECIGTSSRIATKTCKALVVPPCLNGTSTVVQFCCDCHDKMQESRSKTSNYKSVWPATICWCAMISRSCIGQEILEFSTNIKLFGNSLISLSANLFSLATSCYKSTCWT